MLQIETSVEVVKRKTPKRYQWAPEEAARAVQLFHEGVKSAVAARMLGRSHGALVRCWHKHGLRRRPCSRWPSAQELAGMCRVGWSVSDIARHIHKERSVVSRHLKRRGLRARDRRDGQPEDIDGPSLHVCKSGWQTRFVRPEDRRHGR